MTAQRCKGRATLSHTTPHQHTRGQYTATARDESTCNWDMAEHTYGSNSHGPTLQCDPTRSTILIKYTFLCILLPILLLSDAQLLELGLEKDDVVIRHRRWQLADTRHLPLRGDDVARGGGGVNVDRK